jgi:DNA polymerase III sliding clamp (beta) subunit (PCNA family)
MTSDNPDLGEVREEVAAEYSSEPIAIGFNPRYLSSCGAANTRARWVQRGDGRGRSPGL